jgi:hypothetical protein
MGFWLQLGVSGFRMDAVPFVISAKGATVRRPIEHYDMLRMFREFLTWREGDAIILAEANVLPNVDLNFAGARRGQSFEILGIAGRLFDLPEALDMARQALHRSRSQTVRGAIIFLEDYFKAREGMEVPYDIHTALLTVAETTDSRSTATGALNVLVETGEISDMEALDRLDDWKDKHNRR